MPLPAVPPELPVTRSDVKTARRRTRALLGSDLESKATDEFCLAFTTPGLLGFAEAAGALEAPASPAVLEFADRPDRVREVPEAEDASRAIREGLDAAGAEISPADSAVSVLLRQVRVKEEREAFYREAGSARDHLERSTSALARGRPASVREAAAERPFVQLCWLNRTVRTIDARSVSNVAADPAVQRVDVPRRLQRDEVAVDITLEATTEAREALGLSGSGVTVGVIDSEAALRHPAFQDRLLHRRNFTDEPWGTPDSHGTAVAGIIGANSPEYLGLAPEAKIYNYKVLASSSAFDGSDFEGTLAIQQAVEDGVRVANCSWGAGPAGDGTSREARACDRAWRFGLTVVKSAGNNGPGEGTLTTPADAEGVIVVGATDGQGRAVEDYSSRGPAGRGRIRPHLLAPGGAAGTGLEGLLPTGGFGPIGWGTSFAAPHITGLIALLLDSEPELSPDAQRDRLVKACRKLGRTAQNSQGAGLVLPERLLAVAPTPAR